MDFSVSNVGLLHSLPTLVIQKWPSNLGFLVFDLPRLESVSLYPMLDFLLIFHWFSTIIPMKNQCISKFGISQFFPVLSFTWIILVKDAPLEHPPLVTCLVTKIVQISSTSKSRSWCKCMSAILTTAHQTSCFWDMTWFVASQRMNAQLRQN